MELKIIGVESLGIIEKDIAIIDIFVRVLKQVEMRGTYSGTFWVG